MAIAQNTKTITGVVIDENNEPLIGVTVMPVGAQGGAVTDFDGKYSITVPQSVKQIQFSYVGYTTQVVDITGETLNITMKSDNALQEVVVIGYGVQKKTDLTGAITSLSTKDFNQGVITTPEELINGKISGVQIVNDGGSPTGGTTIRIRGGASLNATNDPLIVIDGVPMATSQSITGSGNPLSLVNPSDIETMTVLKDASSTAIYGSRASNGVILITTKKGSRKDKRPHFTFSTTNNVLSSIKSIDMVNGQQIFNEDWQKKINSSITDTGNALESDEVIEWGKQINAKELKNYMITVGKNTRQILSNLSLEQIKSMVPEEWVMRILEEGGVTTDFRSVWLLVFWGRLTVGGMILTPMTSHHMMHLPTSVDKILG